MMVLYVQVMDQNDNSPEFNNLPYLATVPENISVGASVFQVNAYDIDGADFQPIRLSIIEGNYGAVFRIDETGTVFVNNSLDRETTSLYELVIAATDNVQDPDNSRTSTTTLTITVLDVNELPIEFTKSLYFGRVQEGQPTGTLIQMETGISAVDGDTGLGTEITYTLQGRGSTLFSIDPMTGVMTTASVLDYEQMASFYFNVKAEQSGGDFAYATINITVENINDEVPVFTSDVVNVSVAENSMP
ncbi:protocadherin Fat 4-like, partial [Anneissia japonica]|uniref:protocadherin Fat 4-like n=1 Tax=Anneissia japonica TaxID=1529436 RepID=UPI001425B3EB